ncbi:MAG: lysoplasmalogenase family protein [Bacilli bacterium]|jgi:uncharacterized membrane protein YhhN
MFYLFIIVGMMIISMFIYMYYHFKVPKETNLALKLITSFWFVLLGIIAIFLREDKNINLSIMMLIGLICGFLGDAILGLRKTNAESNKVFFCMGLVVFMIGNIFYSRVYLTFSDYPQYAYFFIAMVIAVILIAIFELTKIKLGYLRAPNYIYTYVSSFLLTAVALGIVSPVTTGKILALFGVISFITSDIILNYLYFKKVNPVRFRVFKYINILTYYLGQTLIALSIYFLI